MCYCMVKYIRMLSMRRQINSTLEHAAKEQQKNESRKRRKERRIYRRERERETRDCLFISAISNTEPICRLITN